MFIQQNKLYSQPAGVALPWHQAVPHWPAGCILGVGVAGVASVVGVVFLYTRRSLSGLFYPNSYTRLIMTHSCVVLRM